MTTTSRKQRHLRRLLAPVIQRLPEEGVTVDAIDFTKNGHIRMTLRKASNSKVFYCASSPSDSRATKNFLSSIRRWATRGYV